MHFFKLLVDIFYNKFRFGKLNKKFSYRNTPVLNKLFAKKLLTPVKWASGQEIEYDSRMRDSLSYQAWKDYDGGHKWLHYFPIYDKIFSPYFSKPVKILEIGVYEGASIKMLSALFPNKNKYVGIDIDKSCQKFENKEEGVFVEIGSQADLKFLKDLVNKHGPFDIIIDDGSHVCSHMIASFNALFADALVEGGIYFVEDTHSNYWRDYRDLPYSFVDFAKHCVELMGSHYADSKFIDYQIERSTEKTVMNITTLLNEVRFFDSIIVFEKTRKQTAPIVIHH